MEKDPVRKYKNSDVSYLRKIGNGSFGIVFEGSMGGQSVAIKVPSDPLKDDVLNELKFLAKLKHPNVVHFYGVLEEVSGNYININLIFEFLNGDVRHFVRSPDITAETLLGISHDIALGMDYIHDLNIIHRDLAARNVLVDSKNVAKICDFGLSRLIDRDAQYFYSVKPTSILPIRWMPKESLPLEGGKGRFNKRSDIWSFGVTIWEVWNRAETPYAVPNKAEGTYTIMSDKEVRVALCEGKNPMSFEIPQGMPEGIKQLLDDIFVEEELRPYFPKIKILLNDLKKGTRGFTLKNKSDNTKIISGHNSTSNSEPYYSAKSIISKFEEKAKESEKNIPWKTLKKDHDIPYPLKSILKNSTNNQIPQNSQYSEKPEEEQSEEEDEISYKAVAIYDYQAEAEDEISFDPGDIITEIDMIDEGWWMGKCRGKKGLFPSNFCKLVDPNEKEFYSAQDGDILKSQTRNISENALPVIEINQYTQTFTLTGDKLEILNYIMENYSVIHLLCYDIPVKKIEEILRKFKAAQILDFYHTRDASGMCKFNSSSKAHNENCRFKMPQFNTYENLKELRIWNFHINIEDCNISHVNLLRLNVLHISYCHIRGNLNTIITRLFGLERIYLTGITPLLKKGDVEALLRNKSLKFIYLAAFNGHQIINGSFAPIGPDGKMAEITQNSKIIFERNANFLTWNQVVIPTY